MTPDERLQLLDAALDGDISEADFLRMEAELTVDPGFRLQYYQRIGLDCLLEREAASMSPSSDASTHLNSTQLNSTHLNSIRWFISKPLMAGLLLGVAASLLCVLAIYPWAGRTPEIVQLRVDGEGVEPSATGFAVLSGQSDAVWAEDSPSMQSLVTGSLLPQGELHLESGLIHLELFSGVQMVVQGEAVFTIDSPMQVSVQSGRVRALVPEPAQGFRIQTDSGEVVDLGTEFTLAVEESGSSIQVVDGEVELYPQGAAMRRIDNQKAWQWSADGKIDEANESIDLIGPGAFQQVLADRQADRIEHWQESRQWLSTDPRLIALYRMDPENGWSRGLENQARRNGETSTVEKASDGAVVAASRSEDRWGREHGALDFSQMGSRVRVTVPGEHRGLTLLCWVRINSLDRWYNSLFLTDGHQEREPHWQIMEDGRLFFSVKLPIGKHDEAEARQHVYYSPPFWNTSLSGKWMMLCTTYDVDAAEVTHYVNGVPISTEPILPEWLVDSITIGAASICNWSEPMYRTDPNFVVRNLNGSLDEFVLFSGALSADEILDLFETGNPNES